MRDVILGIIELFKSGGYGALSVVFIFAIGIIAYFIWDIAKQLKRNWIIIDKHKDTLIEHKIKLDNHDIRFCDIKENIRDISQDIKTLLKRG